LFINSTRSLALTALVPFYNLTNFDVSYYDVYGIDYLLVNDEEEDFEYLTSSPGR